MKLILVRHGETKENNKGILQGQRYGILSHEGIRQSKLLANRLSKEKMDVIYTSKIKRAIQTAEEITKFHKVQIIFSEKLNARSFGDFEGISYTLFDRQAQDNKIPNHLYRPSDNAENFKDVEKRVLEFFHVIKDKHFGKTVLIVGHSTPNKVLIAYFMGIPLEKARDIRQSNGALNIIEYDGEKFKVDVLNDTSHLKTE